MFVAGSKHFINKPFTPCFKPVIYSTGRPCFVRLFVASNETKAPANERRWFLERI